jgi:hypothetical protein
MNQVMLAKYFLVSCAVLGLVALAWSCDGDTSTAEDQDLVADQVPEDVGPEIAEVEVSDLDAETSEDVEVTAEVEVADAADAVEDTGEPPIPCGAPLTPVGPPCCVGGNRVSDGECRDGVWFCAQGGLCQCAGAPITFVCSDFCGSGAFVDAVCGDEGWSCGALVRSDSCPPETCWGDPGDCCINPSCVDNRWECERIGEEGVDC